MLGEKTDDGCNYCCLGVLASIVDPKAFGEYLKVETDSPIENDGLLSDSFIKEHQLGELANTDKPLDPASPVFKERLTQLIPVQEQLAMLNDGGYDFNQIADIIEKELLNEQP